MRTEKDFLGTMEIPEDALYGIHSVRARENFPEGGEERHDTLFIRAYLMVKKAVSGQRRKQGVWKTIKADILEKAADFLLENPEVAEKM